tara:strand:+ start:1886 stop:2530 length:645 start_codon:yes stop_codon:yes gene_type:complete
MVYPWSKKPKEEGIEAETEIKEEEKEKTEEVKEDNGEDVQEMDDISVREQTATEEVVDSLILNILKLEGYKMDSGELFQAFKEAGGEMENFKSELDKLSELGKIKSDSDGNIMTVQDYQQEKSRQEDDDTEESNEDETEDKTETKDETSEEENQDEDIESIIKLKEETDTWLIEQLKNKENSGNNEELRDEISKLKERVQKLENVIKNMNKAFE